MGDKFKVPRKTVRRGSLSPEQSTDDEAKKVERKVPYKALLIKARPFEPFEEDDSTDSDATSPEEWEVSLKKSNDAINDPPNKKRSKRKMYTPRRFIFPEAEVNQTDAKPCNSGGSEKSHSDQNVASEEP